MNIILKYWIDCIPVTLSEVLTGSFTVKANAIVKTMQSSP